MVIRVVCELLVSFESIGRVFVNDRWRELEI